MGHERFDVLYITGGLVLCHAEIFR
jgi:hypothetical protein